MDLFPTIKLYLLLRLIVTRKRQTRPKLEIHIFYKWEAPALRLCLCLVNKQSLIISFKIPDREINDQNLFEAVLITIYNFGKFMNKGDLYYSGKFIQF